MASTLVSARRSPDVGIAPGPGSSRGDGARALAWFAVALLIRLPFVMRIEGVLDHDQSIVGLMALDIAAGRRCPIFFDGQRYMGALEAYVAAGSVLLFGHSPRSVVLSPFVFFGLFVAGQYALWCRWAGRATGHLAALFSIVGAPLLVLWGLVPRGGYIELLAWSLPVLAIYRRMIRPDTPALRSRTQLAWGFLLAVGYFLNPLSLIVYLSLGLDWTFGRHGMELRQSRHRGGAWLDPPLAWLSWSIAGILCLVILAGFGHVSFAGGEDSSPFVFLFDWLPRRWGAPLGIAGILGTAGAVLWWSGAAGRVVDRLSGHVAFAVGAMLALSPVVAHGMLVQRGVLPWTPSLPIWIRAPWAIGPNLRDGARALGPLIGSDPGGVKTVLIGQGIALPTPAWPEVARWLSWGSPVVATVVLGLLAAVVWTDRRAWRRFWSLRGDEPTPPTVLATLGIGVMAGLYLLQGTSLNASSIRYLLPTWIFLPGLLAVGLRRLPAGPRRLSASILLVGWGVAQVNLWADLDRPSPARPLARELERRQVAAIVAPTPVALLVANLTSGRVGAIEYHPHWPRLRDRYADRFAAGRPVVCVVDRDFPWPVDGVVAWSPRQDLGLALQKLAVRQPGRVRIAWEVGRFEVWEVDLPLSEVLAAGPLPLPSGDDSAKVFGYSPSQR